MNLGAISSSQQQQEVLLGWQHVSNQLLNGNIKIYQNNNQIHNSLK